MECNREEATRAKEVAEKKFKDKDILGAKKFALKAQSLNPELDGVSQMVATFEVYLASENKISGETDWYAILGVNPVADDDAVKKQYRKLALILHPDKNKSVGAEGAFKLLSEAWSVLSDKTRRMKYDQKRNVKSFQQNIQQPSRDSSVPHANNFYNFKKTTSNSNVKHQKTTVHPTVPTSVPPTPRPTSSTFWTACNLCKMQYEYLRVYLNHNLLCPNCRKPFLAVETGNPANGSNPSVSFNFSQQQLRHNANKNANVQGRSTASGSNVGTAGYKNRTSTDSINQSNFPWSAFSKTTGVANTKASSCAAAQAANVVHSTYEKVRREREEAQAASRREEAIRRKNYPSWRASTTSVAGYSNAASNNSALDREHVSKIERPLKKRRDIDDGGARNGIDEGGEAGVKGHTTIRQTNVGLGLSENERVNDLVTGRNILAEKARKMICSKLAQWNVVACETAKVEAAVEKVEVQAMPVANDNTCEESKSEDLATGASIESINVPDPDFHDFDKDRTEKAFDANQVWAAYDDDDGMPRFYALIQKVISVKPFKMRFSWLNSKTNNELGPINWVGSGFTKTCGEFRVGRYEVNDTVNVFSHRVRWEKGLRGVVKILPRTGEVWALYRNWSPNWNENTPDSVVHKYDMVEVLNDYNEENGVSVAPLVKVAGFKTIFHRHMDPMQVKKIPKEEMFRFSHQVPSWLLTGEEAENAPKGCRELDPAATPLELLQVITETTEEKLPDAAVSVQECIDKMDIAEKECATKKDKAVGSAKRGELTKENLTKVWGCGQEGKENLNLEKQMKVTKEDMLMDSVDKMHKANGGVTA